VLALLYVFLLYALLLILHLRLKSILDYSDISVLSFVVLYDGEWSYDEWSVALPC